MHCIIGCVNIFLVIIFKNPSIPINASGNNVEDNHGWKLTSRKVFLDSCLMDPVNPANVKVGITLLTKKDNFTSELKIWPMLGYNPGNQNDLGYHLKNT